MSDVMKTRFCEVCRVTNGHHTSDCRRSPLTWTHPERMGGLVCVYRTRVTLDVIQRAMAGNNPMSDHEIHGAWPTVTVEQIARIRAGEGL